LSGAPRRFGSRGVERLVCLSDGSGQSSVLHWELMTNALSPRLLEIVNALPLKPGIRVLEIGCGPGAAAREIERRIGRGYVLGIDRSQAAIAIANAASGAEIAKGVLGFRRIAIEDFELARNEKLFDLAVAIRVGALDGRHPEDEVRARRRIAAALTGRGRLFIDGGNPLREIKCQFASNRDPLFASNRDPSGCIGLGLSG
jgi:SAM-dependent methyltransferase